MPVLGSSAAKAGTKLSRGANFRCLMSGSPIASDYVKAESMAGRMGVRLMAIVVEGDRGRVYYDPTLEHEEIAHQSEPVWKPDQAMNRDTRNLVSGRGYGFFTWADLFTPRQLVALTIFSELAVEATERVRHDGMASGLPNDARPLRDGGTGATAYAEAVGVYLAFALSKQADLGNSMCRWEPIAQCPRQLFGRQAIPMVWDYAEGNPLGDSSGSWSVFVDGIVRAFSRAFDAVQSTALGRSRQADASTQQISRHRVVSTDPPYYDNIGYADLSDFFYVWLRRSLKPVFPDLFATLAVPKAEELVATPYRHGSKVAAETFFLEGMTQAMGRLAEQAHPGFPVTIYYAFKQSERKGDSGTSSTGWETFLQAVIQSGFSITGTWPMRTENATRLVGMSTNALASSIVLVCRQRATDAAGELMSVREALALINQILDEVLAEQEGNFDADSRWALAWFEQHGFAEGDYGDAETLSKAKNTSVAGMVEAGILASRGGTVKLLAPSDLPSDWNPKNNPRLTAWEAVHHLIQALEANGEEGAAALASDLGRMAETARELCYRLFAVCERRKRSAEALPYNSLVQSWSEIIHLARSTQAGEQAEMFDNALE